MSEQEAGAKLAALERERAGYQMRAEIYGEDAERLADTDEVLALAATKRREEMLRRIGEVDQAAERLGAQATAEKRPRRRGARQER